MNNKRRRLTQKHLRNNRMQDSNTQLEYEKLKLLDKITDKQLKITYLKSVLSLPELFEKIGKLFENFM